MAAKEGWKTRAQRAKREWILNGRLVVRAPALLRWAEAVVRFCFAAVLSGAEVFGGYAPFGAAMVGACGAGTNGLSALLGACFGYFFFRGLVDGLRYAAASILIFAVAFAFCDNKVFRKSWFMPLITAAMTGCTGFVYLSQSGWRTKDVIFFGLEVLLSGAGAYFYRCAFQSRKQETEEHSRKRTVSLLVLGTTTLISLAQLQLGGVISLGRILAATAVLLCAETGGMGAGAACGVAAGLAMDMAAGDQVFFSMLYGFSGLLAGVFRRQGKVPAAGVFLLSQITAVLWVWSGGLRGGAIAEAVLAAGIFCFLPQKVLRKVSTLFRGKEEEQEEFARRRMQLAPAEYLNAAAAAFHDLYETMHAAFRPVPQNDGDTAVIFDRAAERVCRACPLQSTCWEREYAGTFNALNDALPAMLERGEGEKGDFAPWFASRCIHFPAFLQTANEELKALLYRRQFRGRLQENRTAVVGQYGHLASLLRTAAMEAGEELLPDPVRGKRLRQRMEELGLSGTAAVFQDRNGRLRAEIDGRGCETLATPEELQLLSKLLNVPLTAEKNETPGQLILRQSEPLKAVMGAAVRQKSGQAVNGDAGVCFKSENGKMYLLLCDGMGSGPEAARDSGMTARLLEQFLRAGVEPEDALRTVNGALALYGEEGGGFSTVDLLEADLYTGEAALYKYGAAATFVKRGDGVTRWSGGGLPAGLCGSDAPPAMGRLSLKDGDCVVMLSDGVASSSEEENRLKDVIRAFSGESPAALAKQLLSGETPEDDQTALVLMMKKRT